MTNPRLFLIPGFSYFGIHRLTRISKGLSSSLFQVQSQGIIVFLECAQQGREESDTIVVGFSPRVLCGLKIFWSSKINE